MASTVALELVLTKALSFLLDNGCDRKDVIDALRRHADTIESGQAPHTSHASTYKLWLRVSGVVYDWCSDASCTHEGKPRALTLEGEQGSLRALVRRRFPDRETQDIVAWMMANGLVGQQSDGLFVLREGALLIADSEPLLLERLLTLAGQYLETSLNNLRFEDRSQRHFDRTARVIHLPAKFLPQFHQMVEKIAQAFLDSIDDWLEGRNAPDTNEVTVEAGVHCYAYTDQRARGLSAVTPRETS